MTNNELVHVNGYTRKDGTDVSEYYRSAPNSGGFGEKESYNAGVQDYLHNPELYNDSSFDPASMLLQGGVEENVYNPNYIYQNPDGSYNIGISNSEEENQDAAIANFPLVNDAINILSTETSQIPEKIDNIIDKIEQNHIQNVSVEKTLLDNLVNAKDQKAYSKIYPKYLKQKEYNSKTEVFIKRFKYANYNNDYQMLYDDLQNYKSDFKDIVNRNYWRGRVKSTCLKSFYQEFPYSPKIRIINYLYKSTPKNMVDFGMWVYNTFKYKNTINDAKEMWKASSHNFLQSTEYIKRNGALVYSVSEIPSKEFQDIIKTKLKKSNMNDSIGMIYHADSNLSKQISDSKELKEKFQENQAKLIRGGVVKGASIYLGDNPNLALSLGHVDIPYMFIDKDKQLCSIALDVYDFDPNDRDWKVRVAEKAQAYGFAKKYYSIHIVKTPLKVWKKWISY